MLYNTDMLKGNVSPEYISVNTCEEGGAVHTLRARYDFLSPDEDIKRVAELRVVMARHRVERPNLQWDESINCE